MSVYDLDGWGSPDLLHAGYVVHTGAWLPATDQRFRATFADRVVDGSIPVEQLCDVMPSGP